jgi:hypothetical protein
MVILLWNRSIWYADPGDLLLGQSIYWDDMTYYYVRSSAVTCVIDKI